MKKIFCLSTCSTCQRIIHDIDANARGFELQDIKREPLSAAELEKLRDMAGSYDALFSRRALKYKEMGLKDKKLSEKDLRKLILQEYTFLKRPVIVFGDKIFAGSEKNTLTALYKSITIL